MNYPKKPKYPLNCTICNKQFFVYKYRLKTAKFCSYECYGKALKGRHLSEKTKKFISEYRKLHPVSTIFKKGHIPWCQGTKGVMKSWNKGGKAPWATGSKNPKWKGDKVGYRSLHSWIEKQLGKPSQCSHCGKNAYGRNIHWANKSGKYNRNLNNWIRLCIKCHGIYDSK